MINRKKLKNVVQKDGKIEAQCPACAAAGADKTGNHFVMYPNGAFGCVANPDDKEHDRKILELVGERGSLPPPQLVVRPIKIPTSTVLLKIGRIGRSKPPSPEATGDREPATEDDNPNSEAVAA